MGKKILLALLAGTSLHVMAMENEELNRKLYFAAVDGDRALAQELINHGADINFTDEYGSSMLVHVIERRHFDAAKLLIELGANINQQGKYEYSSGLSPLHLVALGFGDTNFAQFLIDHGAYVDATDAYLKTPLLNAAEQGNYQMVKLLWKNGALINVHSTGEFGTTPLIAAARNGNFPIVDFLLKHGAEVNAQGAFDTTALHEAAAHRHAEIVKLLIEHGANLDAITVGDNYTPLTGAIIMPEDNEEVILLLLSAFSNKEAQEIRNNLEKIFLLRSMKPQLPRDMRRVIALEIADTYVQKRMQKMRDMITATLAARAESFNKGNPKNVKLVALNTRDWPASQERIRKAITNNVKRILLGEPKRIERTREQTIEEALGEWLEEPQAAGWSSDSESESED